VREKKTIPHDKLILAKDIRIERDAMDDEELLQSIQENGVEVDLLVRPSSMLDGMYEIWDGRRRSFRLWVVECRFA